MEIGSASSLDSTSSIQGMQRAFARNAERAKRVSNPDGDPQLDKDMAELPSDKQDVAIQAKVIKTKDQMLGSLLDMLA